MMLLFAPLLGAQQSFSININKNMGLPSLTVYDFLQDTRGFIWIASNSGLTRYDGFEFITYTSPAQTSLPGSSIYRDKYGRVWYQNFDGYLYYVKEDQMHALEQNKPGEFVPFGVIDDYLFVIQQNGVDVFDLSSLKLLRTIEVNAYNVLSSTVLNNAYYFLGENVVYKIDKKFNVTQSDYFVKNGIKVNRLENDGKELFLTYKNREEHEVFFMDKQLNFSKRVPLPSKGWIIMQQFYNNQYWLYTNKGFYVYDKNWNLVLSDKNLNVSNNITKCLIDKYGNYWFSSLMNGMYLITDFNNKIYHFDNYSFRHIIRHSDGYLVSTTGGQILELDQNLRFKRTIIDLGKDVHITYFQYDEQSDLLFYTTTLGLHIHHKGKQIYFQDIAAKSVMKLDHKYFAVTTSGSVLLLKNPLLQENSDLSSIWDNLYNKNKWVQRNNLSPLMSNLRAKSINFYDDNQRFIVSSNVGLVLFDTKGASPFLVEDKNVFANEIYTYNKKVYLLDNHGNLHVVYRSGKSTVLNPEIGIPLNSIRFIKRFGNTLYIVCPNRVFELDMTSSMSRTYSFNTNHLTISDIVKSNEQLIVLAESDIVSIGLNQKSIQKNIPDFYFNSILVNNEHVAVEELTNLNSNQNSIRVTFSLLDYGSNVEPSMSYRVNKGEWVKLTAGSREVQLIALSPGEYTLEMKMNGTVLKQKLNFSINYPFYMKWWFILSVIGLVILITAGISLWRTFSMRKKIRNLNEKIILENQLRTSMLTSIKAQMNPHFFYNALNTIQAYIFTNDKHNATTYLAKFSKLTRMILEMSGQTSIRLEDEITSLNLYLQLEQMRFQSDFNYEIVVEENLERDRLMIPAMLIQPYVENAVKHGLLHKEGEKRVSIHFDDAGEFLEVIIDDNGIGRKRSDEINRQKMDKPKSFSTESNKMRLDLINHNKNVVSVQYLDKYDAQEEATGTTVKLFISKNYHGN